MKINPSVRGADCFGSGHYGASRGSRKHVGLDYACYPGSAIYPDKDGCVTKIGYPYGDDLSFRYIEIEDDAGYRARYFYVQPKESLKVGDFVHNDEIIGHSQELGVRYPGITEHVHLETFTLIDGKKEYFDPASYYLRK